MFGFAPRPTSLRVLLLGLVGSLLLSACSVGGLCGTAHGPSTSLPALLPQADAPTVRPETAWWTERRPEILALYRTHVFGELPPSPPQQRIEVLEVSREARGGTATRKQLTIHFTEGADGPRMDVLVYLPNDSPGPVPVFAGLNFAGNHTVAADPSLRLPHSWVPDRPAVPSRNGRALPAGRGALSSRWPVDSLLQRGYGLMTAYYGDLFPDHPGGFANSVYQLHPNPQSLDPAGGDWGAISAWAWGLHRLMDYATRTPAIDSTRVIAVGHSRLAKTALWASATDPRFAAVVDNASGLGGSALFRRDCGRSLRRMDRTNPHWFSDTFRHYRGHESALPVDQHQLLALSAPRPLLVNAMTQDRGADPMGMFLATRHASAVWRLLGTEGLSTDTLPSPGTAVLSRVGFRLRRGPHSITPQDWSAFLTFADRHVKRTERRAHARRTCETC